MSREIDYYIKRALDEDRARADITTKSLFPSSHISSAKIVVKEKAVLCGLEIAKQVFKKLDKNIRFSSSFGDGRFVKANTVVAKIKGRTRAILAGERTALNFLSYLSGIATQTAQYVVKARPLKTKILDTRKTTPTLRALEKYAVHCGGGHNHRFHLNDMVMIKDNHRQLLRDESFLTLIQTCRKHTKRKIELEVDTLSQFKEALKAKPGYILLDNMNIDNLRKAVSLIKKVKGKRPLLEASGGITLKNIRRTAQTGVDCISVGALTHHHRGINISLEVI